MDNQQSPVINEIGGNKEEEKKVTLEGWLFNFLIFSVIFLFPLLSVVILYRAINQ